MACHEVDGNGNIKIHVFTVDFTLYGESEGKISACFTDYAEGWDWVRSEANEWVRDEDYDYDVDIDSEWVEDSVEAIEDFYRAHDTVTGF